MTIFLSQPLEYWDHGLESAGLASYVVFKLDILLSGMGCETALFQTFA